MSYEFYKVLHLASVFILLACTSVTLMGSPKKIVKIVAGIASFLILVAGMGLLARLGQSHGEAFPTWVVLKMLIWGILAIGGPIAAKRLTEKRGFVWVVAIVLAIISAALAIYKP